MDILKRPMFYVAVVCCMAAALSLFEKILSFVVLLKFYPLSLNFFVLLAYAKWFKAKIIGRNEGIFYVLEL